VKLKLGRLFY